MYHLLNPHHSIDKPSSHYHMMFSSLNLFRMSSLLMLELLQCTLCKAQHKQKIDIN